MLLEYLVMATSVQAASGKVSKVNENSFFIIVEFLHLVHPPASEPEAAMQAAKKPGGERRGRPY